MELGNYHMRNELVIPNETCNSPYTKRRQNTKFLMKLGVIISMSLEKY